MSLRVKKNMVIIANLFGDQNPWTGKPSETSEIFWNSTSRMTDWFAISSGMTIPPFSEGLTYQSDSELHHDGQNWSDDHGPIHPIFWWHTWKVWTWKLVRKQSIAKLPWKFGYQWLSHGFWWGRPRCGFTLMYLGPRTSSALLKTFENQGSPRQSKCDSSVMWCVSWSQQSMVGSGTHGEWLGKWSNYFFFGGGWVYHVFPYID